MSMEALRAIRPISVTPTQKVVLWALADQANDAGEAWPSIASLMQATCLKERAVQIAIMGLRDAGHLTTEVGGGRNRTTVYKLNLPAVTPQEMRGKASETGHEMRGNAAETPHMTTETPHEVRKTPHHVHPNPQEPSSKKEEEKKEGRAVALVPELPSWLPADAWADWQQHRKTIRKPMTDRAAQLAIRDLGNLRKSGSDPRAVIEQSISSGWTGLFALKNQPRDRYRNGFVAVAERLANDEPEPYDPDPNPFLTYEASPHVH